MYCKLFCKYINDHECGVCDSRSGYEKDTWKYTCEWNRAAHHPIVEHVKWWVKPTAFKQKLFTCIASFVNFLKPKRMWFVHWDNSGLHVGNLSHLSELMKE